MYFILMNTTSISIHLVHLQWRHSTVNKMKKKEGQGFLKGNSRIYDWLFKNQIEMSNRVDIKARELARNRTAVSRIAFCKDKLL